MLSFWFYFFLVLPLGQWGGQLEMWVVFYNTLTACTARRTILIDCALLYFFISPPKKGIKEFGWRCNNDGIDIVSSQDVIVENVFIRSADDAIAVKGVRRPSDYVNHVHNNLTHLFVCSDQCSRVHALPLWIDLLTCYSNCFFFSLFLSMHMK